MLTKLKKIILLLGDFAFSSLALAITLLLRYPRAEFTSHWLGHWPHFLVISLIWLMLFYINGLYDLNLRIGRKFFRCASSASLLTALISVLYFYLNSRTDITPKTNLAIFIACFFILFIVWRYLFQVIIGAFIPKERLAIIGFNAHSEELIKEIGQKTGSGYEFTAIFKDSGELTELADRIKRENIRTLVVVDDFGQSANLRQLLFDCLAYKITIYNYPDFYETLTGKIPLDAIEANWFLENLQSGRKNYFITVKRIADIIGAILILIISLPVWPLIALAIKLGSRGPVFFRQDRVGQNGRIFSIIKFRTMREEDNDRSMTVEGDKRITRIGAFLRSTRLDEIPQVINILKGEMSFIGPRPERPETVSDLERKIPFYKTRLLIKPGVTGWDQISGHYHSPTLEDSREKLQYDLFYLKQRSLYLDLSIALKTLATMMSRGGR
ncbi:MAG: sugar transferase [Patescibacteria group bacterium]|jgi:exopolysaccharide biosynthesis polyprenyl glycosylphosphotransferase